MTSSNPDRRAPVPLFLQGSAGRIFVIYHAPPKGKETSRGILYLPPFAEEMNRSRRMVSLQAQELASCGYGVLLLDLHGTGDSEGEFHEACLANWLADVELASDWLMAQGHQKVDLWGLRFGALLAAAAIERSPQRFARSLFWQPVTNGRQMMTQFLRIALTSSWTGSGARMTPDAIRGQLSNGREVEIGGYQLSSELVTAIEAMSLTTFVPTDTEPLYWFEVGPDPSDQLVPASRTIVDAWRARGFQVADRRVVGPQFWTTAEIAIAPELLAATTDALGPS